MLPFFTAPNLVLDDLEESAPWDFKPDHGQLAEIRTMHKEKRRSWMLKKDSRWNVYTSVRSTARRLRVKSKENPPAALRGLVCDYDTAMSVETVLGFLKKIKEPNFMPNYIESTLSGNARLVWMFEREVLLPNPEFCKKFMTALVQTLRADKLLAAYDDKSTDPAMMWTNGGQWHLVKESPVPWQTVFGIVCQVSAKVDFGNSEIPYPILHGEIEKRWPGRWKGPFELDKTGVRFWDDLADNDNGCQVKPDGMLCFTGRIGFMKWEQILGAEWCAGQRTLELGKYAADTYFDGRHYWQLIGDKWSQVSREDVLLALRAAGVPTRPKRGEVASQIELVLRHIQTVNRVDGAAPVIARPSGIIYMDGARLVNTSNIKALPPAEGIFTPETHFPWLWHYLNNLFDNPHLRPLDHFLAWLQRFYLSIYKHEPLMGQALFLCGPRNNGKTLLGYRVIKAMAGDRAANPYDFFTGAVSWNDDLLSSPLLMVNDEEAPTREEVRQKFIARLKAWVVNPSHMHQARFCTRVNVEYTGRFFGTLNDDPGSAGLLPVVHNNTRDKLMFFGSRARPEGEPWEENKVTEKRIAEALPFFARWLLDWTPPAFVIEAGRMGVKSFFDPKCLNLAKGHDPSHLLLDLIKMWIMSAPFWNENVTAWEGTAGEFMQQCDVVESLDSVMREWNSGKLSRAFQSLARGDTPGIEFAGNGGRRFRVTRQPVLDYIETETPKAPETI